MIRFDRVSCSGSRRKIARQASAAVIRGEERDISDLREAGITREEFEAAIDYICKYQGPDDGQFRQYQLDDIEVLRGWLFK